MPKQQYVDTYYMIVELYKHLNKYSSCMIVHGLYINHCKLLHAGDYCDDPLHG